MLSRATEWSPSAPNAIILPVKYAVQLGAVILLAWNVVLLAQTSPTTENKFEYPMARQPAATRSASDHMSAFELGSLQVLGDTEGVDFVPYIQQALDNVKGN